MKAVKAGIFSCKTFYIVAGYIVAGYIVAGCHPDFCFRVEKQSTDTISWASCAHLLDFMLFSFP